MYADVGDLGWVADLLVDLVELCEEQGCDKIAAPLVRAIEEIAPIVKVASDPGPMIHFPQSGGNVVSLMHFRGVRH
jgi:hypothetical protein